MLKLKSFVLKQSFIQSPMAGCTDLAFRLIARQHGMELAFLEMVSAEALVRKNKKTAGLLKRTEEDVPLGAQLVGARPDVMAEAAQMIEEMGFQVLDINLGCPVPKITGAGGGCALMAKPKTAQKIFEAVAAKTKRIPLTVKMRTGYLDPSGKEAVLISNIAEDTGFDAVTVHGRTRAQGYQGKADWEIIGKVKKAVGIPVFGNGDILCGADAKRMMGLTGCDGVVVGRGALGNPWIYGSLRSALRSEKEPPPPDFAQRKKIALQHLDLEFALEGEKIAVLKCRKILCWYFKHLPGVTQFRSAVYAAETEADLRHALHTYRLPDGAAQWDLNRSVRAK